MSSSSTHPIEKAPEVSIVNVLPADVYRGKVAPRPVDVLFPLFEPIIAFGGVSSYFLLALAAYRRRFATAGIMSFFQAMCVVIGNASEDSPLLQAGRRWYLMMAKRALPMMEYLDPIPPHEGATRPRCVFLLPHGLFCIAGKRYCSDITVNRRHPGKDYTFFVDDKLCALSPMMKASARLCGSAKIYPVGDKHVRTAMSKSEDCVVFPGGFVEATCTSRSCLRLYTGTYGYWVNRCIEYGYDIEVVLIYHGSEIWEQGEAFFESRLSLAKKGMPGILPTFPNRTPLAVRELFYSPKQQEPGSIACVEAARELSATIIKDLVSAYSNDAARVFELTGKPLKRLEIIGKPLVGELPKSVQRPGRKSSMSRL